MKTFYLIPLLFLSACSTAPKPKLALRPQQPPPLADNSAVRYPEILHAYHVGRYADPNDDLIMHEQHVVYRVEENTRWNFHPGTTDGLPPAAPSRDAAFAPVPVKDLPEDQKETVIAQIGRTARRAVARVQGQQQQKAEGVGV